jgi:hypothetical protein
MQLQQLLPVLVLAASTSLAAADGVPPIIVKLVKSHYDADNAKGLLDTFGGTASAFDARWKALTSRRAEVQKAVDSAAALEKAGKLDDAIAAVTAVVTKVARDPEGQLPRKRDVIEVRDAEIPAILAWARLAEAKKDITAAPDIAAALFVRRKLSDDKLTEELLWFGDAVGDQLKFMSGDADDKDEVRVREAINDAPNLGAAGSQLAWGYYKSMDAHFGVVRSAAEDSKKANKGQTVLMDLAPDSFDAKALSFDQTEKWKEPVECHLTDKLDSIDPVTGKISYKQACTYKDVMRHTVLKGAFAVPPPAWAKPKQTMTLAAHVDVGGPKWKLSDVRVLDFRFLKAGDGNGTANILDMLGQGDEAP